MLRIGFIWTIKLIECIPRMLTSRTPCFLFDLLLYLKLLSNFLIRMVPLLWERRRWKAWICLAILPQLILVLNNVLFCFIIGIIRWFCPLPKSSATIVWFWTIVIFLFLLWPLAFINISINASCKILGPKKFHDICLLMSGMSGSACLPSQCHAARSASLLCLLGDYIWLLEEEVFAKGGQVEQGLDYNINEAVILIGRISESPKCSIIAILLRSLFLRIHLWLF